MRRNLCLGALLLAGISAVGPNDIRDEGVGTYTDPSVANQISNFTINRQMVSCGVGTVANGMLSGPFAMLMYAKDIQFYHAEHAAKTITASGRMRSITQVGGMTVEDVEHDFLAIAVDNAGTGTPDRFDVHFTTPFWSPTGAGAAFCTPSTVHPGWCRFGGDLIVSGGTQLGDVSVGP